MQKKKKDKKEKKNDKASEKKQTKAWIIGARTCDLTVALN